MRGALRCVATERSLVPAARMTVLTEDAGVEEGDQVMVVHRDRDRGEAGVGTVATVEESRAAGEGTVLLTVTGLYLADVRRRGEWAVADPIDLDATPEASSLVETATAALRAYMAARAEAGEGGDVHVALSPDPVMAANQVASHLRVTWPEIQEILEAGDALARLRRGSAILERETNLLRTVMGRSEA